MDYIGLDLGKTSSQLCILTEDGELIEQRIKTSHDNFNKWPGGHAPPRTPVEATTESEWVARCLEAMGHEVVVADPTPAAMYATRSRRVKTDKRDARTLCEACRLGTYRHAHRPSEAQRQIRKLLTVREMLVRTRAKYITTIKTLIRAEGLRIPASEAKKFSERLTARALPGHLSAVVSPLVTLLQPEVALLDINMPQQSGIEVARAMQHERLATRVVFLTMHRDEATFNTALDLGAAGYLLKESAIEEIVACLKAVAAGEKFVSPQLSTFLINRGGRVRAWQAQKPTLSDLTPTELRVIKLISEQKTTRAIAELLCISPRTVERHRENICTKLELHGSNALLKFALENKQMI